MDLNDKVYNFYLVVNTVKAGLELKKSSSNRFLKQWEAKKRVVLNSLFGSTLEFCWYVQIEIAHDDCILYSVQKYEWPLEKPWYGFIFVICSSPVHDNEDVSLDKREVMKFPKAKRGRRVWK